MRFSTHWRGGGPCKQGRIHNTSLLHANGFLLLLLLLFNEPYCRRYHYLWPIISILAFAFLFKAGCLLWVITPRTAHSWFIVPWSSKTNGERGGPTEQTVCRQYFQSLCEDTTISVFEKEDAFRRNIHLSWGFESVHGVWISEFT